MAARLKILIVEDDALIAMDLRACLEQAGFDVCRPESTGEAAVAAAASERPDIVLMDIHLAGEMNGVEAARRIQAIGRTGLIFLSGYLNPEVMAEAGELKPFAFLGKPIADDDLVATIRRWRDLRLP